MTKNEYNKEMSNAKLKYKNEVARIKNQYVIENKRFSIGDIVKDKYSNKIIRIEFEYAYQGFHEYPLMEYSGPCLKNDLTPYKNSRQEKTWDERAELIKKGIL